MPTIDPARIIRRRAQTLGLAHVARTLRIPRATIGTYLAGVARAASSERIERRAAEIGWLFPSDDEEPES